MSFYDIIGVIGLLVVSASLLALAWSFISKNTPRLLP